MNKEIILKVENLSKQYRLGTIGTGTISHDVNRFIAKVRGKEDPFLKIGEFNDRATKGNSQYVWALKDINFEVKKGEVLGVIGKNGAGKSTLLKILSKVTGPTTGAIKSNGRIASLLEVGTGFHPEMTGKENIFLNGAILGMTKKEIISKLEEIIDFSGCERYIDTPVKRYSSGMKVRLAFAVAAFLEPDILVVDEVLAVGDAEFQKKAIGKMQDISNTDGRTVLFVSHDMAAVKDLCSRVLVIENGQVALSSNSLHAVNYYLSGGNESDNNKMSFVKKSKTITVENIKYFDGENEINSGSTLNLGIKIGFEFTMIIKEFIDGLCISMNLNDSMGNLIAHISHEDDAVNFKDLKKNGKIKVRIKTASMLFIPDKYNFSLWVGTFQTNTLISIENFFVFDIVQGNLTKRNSRLPEHSKFYLPTKWNVND